MLLLARCVVNESNEWMYGCMNERLNNTGKIKDTWFRPRKVFNFHIVYWQLETGLWIGWDDRGTIPVHSSS
jgi:hypothetical protein